jgi:hypothetical protein
VQHRCDQAGRLGPDAGIRTQIPAGH